MKNMKRLCARLQSGQISRCSVNAHLSKLGEPKAPDWSATKAAARDCNVLYTWYTLVSAEITDTLELASKLKNEPHPSASMEQYRLDLVAYEMSIKVNMISLKTHIDGLEVMMME
jgi:hypothetical protein